MDQGFGRLARRVEHLARIFGAVLEYVRRGHAMRFRSDSNARSDLVMTMTVEEPDELTGILEPGAPRQD